MTSIAESADRAGLTSDLRLRGLIRELPSEDRFLLECRIVDGWNYADIAARVGMPNAVLVQRVREIRAELRRKAKTMLPSESARSGGAGCGTASPSFE